jgi:alpha-L-fucosidase
MIEKAGVMKKRMIVTLCLLALSIGLFLTCKFETAYGPTPYATFTGSAVSNSRLEIGTGVKNLVIPQFLPLGAGRMVTISVDSNDSLNMSGMVTAYDRANGALTVQVTKVNGSGTYGKWNVVVGKTEAQILDSVRQAYSDMHFGMFIHFNMSTFDRCCCSECLSVQGEWGLANTDEKEWRPSALNCGQWADVAKSAGCKYMVLTTKHHDGFCLWPTAAALTKHSIVNATVTRDVVKEFVDSARTRGLKVGFYYSIRDLTNGFALSFIKGQLTELLTNYGEITCIWFDGWGWGPGYNKVPYDTIKNLIRSIQPNCLIIENNHTFNTLPSDIIEYEMPIDGPPKISNVQPAEGCQAIRAAKPNCWFWHPTDNCTLMPADKIVSELKTNIARHASYLLDLTPYTIGVIPQCQADRMQEVGQLLKK